MAHAEVLFRPTLTKTTTNAERDGQVFCQYHSNGKTIRWKRTNFGWRWFAWNPPRCRKSLTIESQEPTVASVVVYLIGRVILGVWLAFRMEYGIPVARKQRDDELLIFVSFKMPWDYVGSLDTNISPVLSCLNYLREKRGATDHVGFEWAKH